ncbi:MAG: VOC family protein [Mycobacterium sp.]
MPDSTHATVLDIAAVVAARDFAAARSWYRRVLGREPDLEPIDGVAEWQITDTSWLQLVTDPDRAGKSMVRFGVGDLAAHVEMLNDAGIATGEPVVIADMVVVVDVADPDGNEVSFVQELTAEPPASTR